MFGKKVKKTVAPGTNLTTIRRPVCNKPAASAAGETDGKPPPHEAAVFVLFEI